MPLLPTGGDSGGRDGVDRLSVAELVAVLQPRLRQEVLTFLSESADREHDLRSLVEHLAERRTGEGRPVDPDRIAIRLHHVHLPKLAEQGLVEFDPERGRVRYRPDRDVERYLERLDEGA